MFQKRKIQLNFSLTSKFRRPYANATSYSASNILRSVYGTFKSCRLNGYYPKINHILSFKYKKIEEKI